MTNRNTSSSTCPSCGNRASGKFCNQCGASLAGIGCAKCGAALEAGARFCNECGTAVNAPAVDAVRASAATGGYNAATAGGGAAKYAPWMVAAVILVSVAGYFAGKGANSGGEGNVALDGSAPFAPFANGASGPAPDISNMSPREQASRLYDRIMRYSEQGKTDSLQVFAPMAMSSFEMLGSELDLDARYDYGRVAQETGNFEVAAAQADTILRQSPNHLLGLALQARTATSRGDASSAAKSWKLFLAAKDAELKKPLPEYQMHASDIEQATRMANGGK